MNHVLDGVKIRTGMDNFGVVRPTEKHWKTVPHRVSHEEKTVTATVGLRTTSCKGSDWSVSHYTLSSVKNLPPAGPAMQPCDRIL